MNYDKTYNEEVKGYRAEFEVSMLGYKKVYYDKPFTLESIETRLKEELERKIFNARSRAKTRIRKNKEKAMALAKKEEIKELKRKEKLGKEHRIKPTFIDINGIARYS